MSAVIIELDKLSSDESESKKDSKSDFKEGKLSEFCAEYCGFQLHCSHSAPAGKPAFISTVSLALCLFTHITCCESSVRLMRNAGEALLSCVGKPKSFSLPVKGITYS